MKNILPGVVASIIIGSLAYLLDSLIRVEFLSPSIIAIFLGLLVKSSSRDLSFLSEGIRFTTKKLLKFSIVLLGGSLNFMTIFETGKLTYTIMFFNLVIILFIGKQVNKHLRVSKNLSTLISAGIFICGGSAIAASSQAIEADEKDISYSMTMVFLIDLALIILMPLLGRLLGMSDLAFGLWSGTGVNDTSSVVATAFSFSDRAGDIGTTVKLSRTLLIIPLVMVLSFKKNMESSSSTINKKKLLSAFPLFIVGFLLLSILYSLGLIGNDVSAQLKTISKFLMVISLAGVGLSTSVEDLRTSGLKPLVLGLVMIIMVLVISYLAIEFLI